MESITLDTINIDNKNYIILDKLTDNNNTYYYLSNEDNPNDFFVQKLNNTNKDELVPLESKEEFDSAINLYNKKYN